MLVTGHAGFIGQALMPKLPISTTAIMDNRGFDLIYGDDIRNPMAISDRVKGQATIVHLAALSGVVPCLKDPVSACGTNVQGSVNVLEAAKQHEAERVLLASSGAVNAPTHPYAASKRAMEDFGVAYRRWLDVTILRFTNIYGPGSIKKSSAIAMFCKQALTSGKITIYGDGEQTRDFVYIQDVVDGIKYAATCEKPPEILEVCSNTQISLNTVAEIVSGLTGASVAHTEARIGDVRSNKLTSENARLTGLTDLETGIKATLEDFKHELEGTLAARA